MLTGVFLTFSSHFPYLQLTFSSRKGLNAQQAAIATKKYKQHRKVGTTAEIRALVSS